MRLIIARHAEMKEHIDDISDDRVEEVLSEKGKQQAEALADSLKNAGINYIYSSNVMRAVATAYIISDAMPEITLMLTKDLSLRHGGESQEEFISRLKSFIKSLNQKYNQHTILLIAHSDVIATIINFLSAANNSNFALAGISEFNIGQNGDVEVIRINDTAHL